MKEYHLLLILILLLLNRPLCTNGMRIEGRWCFTPCKEAKETLEHVPYLVIYCYVVLLLLLRPEIPLLLPSVTLLPLPLPLPLPPLPLPLPLTATLPGQLTPVTTTAYLLAPPEPFLTPHTGLTVIV